MRTIVWYLGLGLVVFGAVLLLAPTFGFETVASDRAADVETADDRNATIGFEATGEAIDGPTDEATVFSLRNNADRELTLSADHRLSIPELVLLEAGDGTLAAGGSSTVTVGCGDYRGTDDATLTVTVDAAGDGLRISGARSTATFLADCDVPALVWNVTTDWDAGTDDRTVHDDVGDRESDTVRLGYEPDASGLVGYWPLDEDGGNVTHDASGNGNDGEHVNGPTPDRPGVLNTTSYEFEAANDQYVRVPNSTSLQTGDSVSVSAWIRIDEQQTDSEFTAIAQKSNQGFNLQLRNGEEPGFTIYDHTWQNVWSDRYLAAGEWHHLVGTYDGDTARIYVDGDEANSDSGIGTMDTGTADLGIGQNLDETERLFDGRIEELRIYDHGLDAATVEDLYAAAQNGTHVTDWRTAEVPLKADRLILDNVTASLGDANATVTVESDHDGDGGVDETSDAIPLEANRERYDVDGITNDTDRVRLRLDLATDDPTRTPIVSRADVTEHYANVTVAIDDTNEPIVEGETLTVDATLENVGSDPAEQTIELRDFDGDVVDERTVELAPRTSTSITLDWATQVGDGGTRTVTVASDDDAASQTVVVQEQASFDVAIDGTNSPVLEGEALTVDATVQNTGDVAATRTVELLDTSGSVVDAADVSLAGGETNDSLQFAWHTVDGDAGSGDVTVRSDDDSASSAVTVQALYTYDSCGTTIDADGRWIQTDDIEYTGSENCLVVETDEATIDGQNHTITVGDSVSRVVDAHRDPHPGFYEIRDLTIEGGQRGIHADWTDQLYAENVTVRDVEEGFHSYTGTEDEADYTFVDSAVYGASNWAFQVQGDNANLDAERLTIGDPHGDGATVSFESRPPENHLELSEVGSPTAAPDGNDSIGQFFEIGHGADALENVRLHYRASDVEHVVEETLALWRDDGGSWTRLDSSVDLANRTVHLVADAEAAPFGAFAAEPPPLEVAIDDTNAPVAEGERLVVNASVTNNGDAEATQTVELRDFDGDVVDSTEVVLASGETNDSVQLAWQTAGGDEGTGTVTVASPDDADAREVTIEDGSEFDVAIDGTNSPVLEGEDLVVDANVTNHGTATDTESVALEDFDGAVVDATNVTLAPGETNDSIALAWTTEKGDYGTDDVAVTSEEDRANRTVTIDRQATFEVAIDETNAPVREGETLTVDANVTNVGDVAGTQTVALEAFDGTVVDSTTVTLDDGATNDSLQFAWHTQKGDNGTDAVAVASEDDVATETVTVEGDPFFDVAIDGTNSRVEEGQTLTVDVNVTNTGDYADEQTIELANLTGDVVDSTTVALGPGETNDSIALAWSTVEGDAGSGDVAVASENDTATANVTVQKLLGQGDLHAENVSADVQPGGENQTFTYVIDGEEDYDNDEFDLQLELAGAQGEGIDYEVNGEPTWTINAETGNTNTWRSESWLTGIHFQLPNSTAGDEIRITITGYQTEGPAGPFTVQLLDNGNSQEVLAEDEFWID